MAKLSTKHRVCSRESSISSLLASCSLSGSSSSNSDGSFQYKDQLYSSASEALQAYIDDFDLSRGHPGANTDRVNIDGELLQVLMTHRTLTPYTIEERLLMTWTPLA